MDAQCPFHGKREAGGLAKGVFGGEEILMLLRHQDVMAAAKDWETYSSDVPFRVPIPSEEHLRKVRQLPIETNPPEHGEYRDIVEPFFKKPRDKQFVATIRGLVEEILPGLKKQGNFDVVRELAVPLQNRALAHLLGLPQSEAEEWIGWGTHVFHNILEDGSEGSMLDAYIDRRIDRAMEHPDGDDLFSALARAEFRGRKLTRGEMAGFANLTFAGGRDTVIHTISSVIAHLAMHPVDLEFLREDPKRAVLAAEEFFRMVSPLTHIGRVCPVDTDVHGVTVAANHRISLCWAAANRDPEVFHEPDEFQINRKPNPHLAFGAGAHFCLGAPHARLIIRELLQTLAGTVSSIEIIAEKPHVEVTEAYQRKIGYESLVVVMN